MLTFILVPRKSYAGNPFPGSDAGGQAIAFSVTLTLRMFIVPIWLYAEQFVEVHQLAFDLALGAFLVASMTALDDDGQNLARVGSDRSKDRTEQMFSRLKAYPSNYGKPADHCHRGTDHEPSHN